MIAEDEKTPGYSVRVVSDDSWPLSHGFRWRPAKGDDAHQKLKRSICKPTRRYLWTPADEIEFIPALSPRIYGDGRALLGFTTINNRPAFYVIRIDSSWACGMDTTPADGAVDVAEFTDEFLNHLEEDFGPAFYEDDGERKGDGDPWPAVHGEGGCSWWRKDWPKLRSLQFEPHPYGRSYNMLSTGDPL